MNSTTQSQQIQDKAKICELTEQWRSLWSPQDKTFTGKGFENLFATEENEILVFDNFDDGVVVLHSLQKYLDTWIPVMENFSYWEIKLEDNLSISIEGNLAVSTFSWIGAGRTKDGQEVKARQYGTHTWKRLDGEWRLVHEHLTVG
ncbi:nuclear transport factor 2 family protein [Pleurocapsa sp. PCC 7319]|uniref:YybH family protein n=1 Tax=Pleurocapsa sp. PCC 7319 TaxID=118161 RepID=UPI0003786B80|nr:nuclear transport factor 2 family protein [Pleurocapsa sp. PCC 7319]